MPEGGSGARAAPTRFGSGQFPGTRGRLLQGQAAGLDFLGTFSLSTIALLAERAQILHRGLAAPGPSCNVVNLQVDTMRGGTPATKHAPEAIPHKDFVAQPQRNITRAPLRGVGGSGYCVLGCRWLLFSQTCVAIGPIYKGLKGSPP